MGCLSFLNSKFHFSASNKSEAGSAMKAGFKLDADSLQWVTLSPHKARFLRGFADGSAERKLKRYFITHTAPPEFISYPDNLAPRSWQIESAWHALTRTPCYIADEAGLGKTITAILAINSLPGKTLITCPPYLRYNWMDELERWHQVNGSKQLITHALIDSIDSDFEADVLVLPDSLLTSIPIQTRLTRHAPFKWLIVDEAHRFKTDDAQRTKALLGDDTHGCSIFDASERTILLSGTPIPNGKPIELYPVLHRIAPESILHRDATEYWKAFCGGKTVTHYERGRPVIHRDLQGASHLKTFRKELKAHLMIRHLKRDHLKELGPKTRQLIFLDTPEKILKLEKDKFQDVALDDLLGGGYRLGDIAKHRREIGLAKIEGALEYVTELLENGRDKLVVSACHIDVVESLATRLAKYGALKIRGGMSAELKQAQVKAFQTDPAKRVMVGNTLSMGLGLTLTRAPILISVEPEWTPGTNEQMEDRVHRMGQDQHVYCRYLVLRNSLDERMLRRSLLKEENILSVMN
jgi:SWI/SNF-related matrix-associated actin-dependent regulator 1 of chromatin subfamily A